MRYFMAMVLAVGLLVLTGLTPVVAQQRIALVVGNSDYKLISALDNPKKDAALMAATLEGLGFEVVLAIDVDIRGMARAVRKFGARLRAAGDDAVGLFYYAGHGVSARGANYLIPLGAEIETESDLEIEATSASSILAQMVDARNALNLVILDACRNNPYKGKVRSISGGLARITTASGALIAFSAAPGQVAVDGDGENSPYTQALVKSMQIPGIPIEKVFKKVRVSVEENTGGKQSPWEESSLRGDFYFVPGQQTTNNAPALPPQSAPPLQPLPQAPVSATTKAETEALFWKSVKDSGDPQVFAAYLETYPDGTFAALAKVLMDNLIRKKQQAAEKAKAAKQAQEAIEAQRSATLAPQQNPPAIMPMKPRRNNLTPPQIQGRLNLTGNYNVEGRNIRGKLYSGKAKISKTGDTYRVEWKIGYNSHVGTGTVHGSVLTVDWGANEPAIYQIMSNGQLIGTWAGGKGAENLTPQ